jgi:hypothetical protein
LDPVEVQFRELTIKLVSIFKFAEDTGEIQITRKVIEMSKTGVEVHLNEYITACYGTTEYPEDLSGVILRCTGNRETHQLNFEYKCREAQLEKVDTAEAVIPQVKTKLSVFPVSDEISGYIREGYAFSPMITLGLTKKVKENEEMITCLKVAKAD